MSTRAKPLIDFSLLSQIASIEMLFMAELELDGLCPCPRCRYPVSDYEFEQASFRNRAEVIALDWTVVEMRQQFFFKYAAEIIAEANVFSGQEVIDAARAVIALRRSQAR
jgi:hypothetical protein